MVTPNASSIAQVRQDDVTSEGAGLGRVLRGSSLLAGAAVVVYALAAVAIWIAFARTPSFFSVLRGARVVDHPEWVRVLSVRPGSPPDRAGLAPGDVIVAVDGVQAGDDAAVRRRVAQHPLGDAVPVRTIKAASQTERDVLEPLESILSLPDAVLLQAGFLAAGLLFVIVGAGVFTLRPRERAAQILFLCATAVAADFALAVTAATSAGWGMLWLRLPQALVLKLGCAAGLHLFLVFPATFPAPRWLRSRRRRTMALAALYGVPLLATIALERGAARVPTARTVSFVLAIGLVAASLVPLARSYARPPTLLARAQLRWLLLALTASVPAVLLTETVRVLPQFVESLVLALVPIALALGVLRYGLFEVNRIIRAAVTYAVLTALLVAGYLLCSFLVSRAAVALLGTGSVGTSAPVLAALAVTALAQPLRARLQRALDRTLYQDRLARKRFEAEAAHVLGQAQSPVVVSDFLTAQAAARLRLTGAWLVPWSVIDGRSAAAPIATGTLVTPTGVEKPSPALRARLQDTARPILLTPEILGAGTAGAMVWAPDEPLLAAWYGAGARLLVPLRTHADEGEGSSTVGWWLLGQRMTGELPDREDLALLRQVGQRAAVLLDYARLSADQVAQALIAQDIERARQIQQRLLPSELTGWPGRLEVAARLRPAREVSGDFYDMFAIPATATTAADGLPALQVAVGDVQGKGVGAALVMAVAQTALRSPHVVVQADLAPASMVGAASAGARPLRDDGACASAAAVLGSAGSVLHRTTGRRDFVCCAVAVVEPPSASRWWGSIRIANAAQVPPLLCRDGNATELVPPGDALPLGILPQPAYQDLVADLQPGDVIIFATDGLPEAPGEAGEFFGFERLAASAALWARHGQSAQAVLNGVWEDVTAWCGAESHHDDMTLLVLRVPTT